MNRTCLFFVTALVSFLFFSCRSMRVIEIETYNPSAITFPPEVKTVMIVNNSAQQPDGVGHSYKSNTKGDSLLYVSVDSMAYHFCTSLGKAIAETPFFYDVRMCNDTLRIDSSFYNVRPFTVNNIKAFCDDYDVDALITLDKLFLKTVFYDKDMTGMHMCSAVTAEISGELRALWPGQKEAYSVPFTDSLAWFLDEGVFSEAVVKALTVSDVQSAMLYLSDFTGRKMHVNFTPHWAEDKRWYYTNISSEWKSGTVYANAKKWGEAVKIWESLYRKSTKWKQKARLLSNIALCNEMVGNFEKASEYAEMSYALFRENDKENSYYSNLQKTYIDILQQRKSMDRMLSKQLGENDD